MPARVSKITAAPATANEPTKPKTSGWLARLEKLQPHIKRFSVWTVLALGGTYAMNTASNHFFSEKSQNQDAKVAPASGGGAFVSASGGWWNPSGVDSHAAPAYQHHDNGDSHNPDPASGSHSVSVSVIPANTGVPVLSGSLNLTNLAPIGSHSSRQAYDVLGLRTGSTPLLASGPMVSSFHGGTGVSGVSLVSFSLSGSIAQVPVNNLEPGGLSVNLVAVPEPTTGVMLAAGFAGLVLTRRRKSRPLAQVPQSGLRHG